MPDAGRWTEVQDSPGPPCTEPYDACHSPTACPRAAGQPQARATSLRAQGSKAHARIEGQHAPCAAWVRALKDARGLRTRQHATALGRLRRMPRADSGQPALGTRSVAASRAKTVSAAVLHRLDQPGCALPGAAATARHWGRGRPLLSHSCARSHQSAAWDVAGAAWADGCSAACTFGGLRVASAVRKEPDGARPACAPGAGAGRSAAQVLASTLGGCCAKRERPGGECDAPPLLPRPLQTGDTRACMFDI